VSGVVKSTRLKVKTINTVAKNVVMREIKDFKEKNYWMLKYETYKELMGA
jgi:hypothetical protein